MHASCSMYVYVYIYAYIYSSEIIFRSLGITPISDMLLTVTCAYKRSHTSYCTYPLIVYTYTYIITLYNKYSCSLGAYLLHTCLGRIWVRVKSVAKLSFNYRITSTTKQTGGSCAALLGTPPVFKSERGRRTRGIRIKSCG
jgi:hypothetical protein